MHVYVHNLIIESMNVFGKWSFNKPVLLGHIVSLLVLNTFGQYTNTQCSGPTKNIFSLLGELYLIHQRETQLFNTY
jgi:hypothetical protein